MTSPIVALWCWYHGGPFKGYQTQPGLPTVQDAVISALQAAGLSRKPLPAGRTDAGVHARMQVLSLRLPEPIDLGQLPGRINAHLPESIRITLAKPAARGFHPQYSSTGKEYRYQLLTRELPEWSGFGWRTEVDPARLRPLLESVVGTRDFAAFHDRTSGRMPRTVEKVELLEQGGGRLEVRMSGPGFARYMVRLLVGSAVAVARGELSESDFRAGLDTAKKISEVRAPAAGLTLWEVRYAEGADPFSAAERASAPGVPTQPPFGWLDSPAD